VRTHTHAPLQTTLEYSASGAQQFCFLSILHFICTSSTISPTSYKTFTSPQTSSKITKLWLYASTPLYIFMPYCLSAHTWIQCIRYNSQSWVFHCKPHWHFTFHRGVCVVFPFKLICKIPFVFIILQHSWKSACIYMCTEMYTLNWQFRSLVKK
jgi:hypothetical protein